MYRQFNIQQLYVLPTQCIYVFCVDLRTNSHYFPIQHYLIVFLTQTESVYCTVRTGLLLKRDYLPSPSSQANRYVIPIYMKMCHPELKNKHLRMYIFL